MADATIVFTDRINNIEQIRLGDHLFEFGGHGDGYCYGHQSFKCLKQLTDAEYEALNGA